MILTVFILETTGLIMGVWHWRNFIKPYLKEMCDKVRAAGKERLTTQLQRFVGNFNNGPA